MSDGYYAFKAQRDRLRREAQALGVSAEGGPRELSARIDDARRRLGPCRECGVTDERQDLLVCDECVARREKLRAAESERYERGRLARVEQRKAAERLKAGLSPGRRRLCDDAGSTAEVMADAYWEVS